MSRDNEKNRSSDEQQEDQQPAVTPAQQGPGVPPITSAPQQGRPASAFVQPSKTVPDGDPRFAIKDAGTPYVVGLGHVSANPTQYRDDQEKARKAKAEKDKEHEHTTDREDSDETR